jgi:hypothetical protein
MQDLVVSNKHQAKPGDLKTRERRWRVLPWLFIPLGIFLLTWLGLRVKPAPFPVYSQASGVIKTMPLPTDLPAPVERFYRQLYGDQIPVISSAVITGRAFIGPVPGFPKLPARFRFVHEAGQNYRHYIEVTFFGMPIMRVNESYLDGKDVQELPWVKVENDPKADQAGNLGMWSEALWFPALFVSDPRVTWEAVDDVTAVLAVPFEEGLERYLVRFDPDTHLIHWFESMRYKGAGSKKVLWLNEAKEYRTVNGQLLPAVSAAIWIDDGKPWAVFTVEDIVLNTDVNDYLRAKGY